MGSGKSELHIQCSQAHRSDRSGLTITVGPTGRIYYWQKLTGHSVQLRESFLRILSSLLAKSFVEWKLFHQVIQAV